MAMVAIPITGNISRLFREIEIPGERDLSNHITLFYLGDDIRMKEIIEMIPTIYDITSKTKPFEVMADRVTCFPKSEKKVYPIIASLKSNELIDFREKIKRTFNRNSIGYDKTHEDFNPHLTLSYNKKKIKNTKLPRIKFMINEIGLYTGNAGDNRMYINFPLSLGVEIGKKAWADQVLELTNMYYDLAGR